LNNLHCFDADSADSLQQVNDVFLVVSKLVGIEEFGDRWIVGLLFFVLVEYPFQGRAVAKFVFPSDRQLATAMPDFVFLVTSSALFQQLFIHCKLRLLLLPERTFGQELPPNFDREPIRFRLHLHQGVAA